MRVELALFDGLTLIESGHIVIGTERTTSQFCRFQAHHRLGEGSAEIVLEAFGEGADIRQATLDMPIHESQDWESIELGKYTLGFYCRLGTEGGADATTRLVRATTERLLLRDSIDADVETLAAYFAEQESQDNVLRSSRNAEGNARFLNRVAQYNRKMPWLNREVVHLTVCLREAGTILGMVSLVYEDSRTMRLGLHFGVAHSGRGYATEAVRRVIDLAFGQLGVTRVYADSFTSNQSVAAVLRKAGMQPTADGPLRRWLRGLGYRHLRSTVRHMIDAVPGDTPGGAR